MNKAFGYAGRTVEALNRDNSLRIVILNAFNNPPLSISRCNFRPAQAFFTFFALSEALAAATISYGGQALTTSLPQFSIHHSPAGMPFPLQWVSGDNPAITL
jgi:hypothetical protein